MDEQHLLNSALTRKNPELFMESAHSLKAVHGVFTENTQVYGPSWVEEWTCLFDKFQMTAVLEGRTCRKALVVTLVQLLNFLKGANDNLEWESVAFSSTGTGMEGLSAVLSGSAVLMDDTGVMRNQVEMRGAKDLSSYLTLAISEDHNICKSHEQRRNLLRGAR